MSEKSARRKRKEAPPAPRAGQPTATVADLLQLLGAKDVEILGLQRQVQMLAEQLAKKEKKD